MTIKRPKYCPACGHRWGGLVFSNYRKLDDGMWQCTQVNCGAFVDLRNQQEMTVQYDVAE